MNIFQGQNGLWGIEDENGVLADAIYQKDVAINMAEFGDQVAAFYSNDAPTTDPRAGLRRCEVDRCSQSFFFHNVFMIHGEPIALLENKSDGTTTWARWGRVRFTDIPDHEEGDK